MIFDELRADMSRKTNFNDNHPECPPGERFVTNTTPAVASVWLRDCFLGRKAYSMTGEPLDDLVPAFTKKGCGVLVVLTAEPVAADVAVVAQADA